MSVIIMAIIAYIIPAILSYISGKASDSDTKSLNHFTMRPVKEISTIGLMGAPFFLLCIIGSSIANQLEGYLIDIFGGLFMLSVFLILIPIKGIWEVSVDGDIVTRRVMWIFKKNFDIHDIEYCTMSRGGYKVFVKGKNNKAFSIDGLFSNTENWEQRMEKEGVKIIF